ncbi:hypothetical protein RQP46_004461 [Phenoliferia psychrophenolica]
MSGIAPYHDAPGADIMPPDGCKVTAAAFLIRHSCIYGNDDEYDDFMEPFILKVAAATSRYPNQIHKDSPLKFLDTWKSPIKKKDLEELTAPGEADAFKFGKRFREMYAHLAPFKVFTASSARDIGTAKAWTRGLFPKWQEGKDGEGDGKYVSLVKVPNDNKDWAASLTPHKICPAFSKENGKPEAQIWLNTFGPAPLARLQEMAPHFDFVLDDVIALFMFCGNDIKYHYQVGYGAPISPYLGVGWLKTATHNLLAAYDPPHPHPDNSALPPPFCGPSSRIAKSLQSPSLLWGKKNRVHSSSELDSDYIRIIVNGAVQELPSCSDGPGGSCEMGAFGDFVAERAELYKDFEGACKV